MALKRTPVQDFNSFSIMFTTLLAQHIKKFDSYFSLLYSWTFPKCDLYDHIDHSMWVTFSLDNGWFVRMKKSTHFSFGGKFRIGIFHMPFIYILIIYFSITSHGVATNLLSFNTEEIARKCTKQFLLLYLLSMCVVLLFSTPKS